MDTSSLNETRQEMEKKTGEFYREWTGFYQGNAQAQKMLMEHTTQPYWMSLGLGRNRLQKRGLTVRMDLQETENPAEYEGPGKDGYDYACRRTTAVKMRRTYYRDGRKVTSMKEPEIATVSFLQADVKGDTAVCPNCGHEGKLSSYLDGCDACGAKFLVSDFETKVSGFVLEEDTQRKSIGNFVKAGGWIAGLAFVLTLIAACAGIFMFGLLAGGNNGFTAVKAAGTMMLGIQLAPVFWHSLLYLLVIFVMILSVVRFYVRPQIQGKEVVRAVIPSFSTGDFLQKLEYQIRLLHLADRKEQVQWFTGFETEKLISQYQRVVDCCLCNVRFLHAEATEQGYRIGVEMKVRLTLDDGKKIRSRYEKLQLKLAGRKEIAEGSNKALREYKCPNCGGSVDILSGGVCEYCKTAIDYSHFGWMITSYKNMGRPENPYARILAGGFGIYALVLLLNLAITLGSSEGKETLELWKQIGTSARYLRSVYESIPYPSDLADSCKEMSSTETVFSVKKEYICEDAEGMKQEYHDALIAQGFLEMQKYPTGFSVFKIMEWDEESGQPALMLEIRTEDAANGFVVTVSFLDENWEPLKN